MVGIHAMLAGMTKVEELQIDATEGKKLGDAVNTVLQQYNHVINPKMAAWVNLGMVSAAVYGPRYMAVKLRHETEKQKPRVVEMPAPFPEPPVPQDRDGSIM